VETFEHVTQTEKMSWMMSADSLERRSLIRFQDVAREFHLKLAIEDLVKRVVQLNRFPWIERHRQRNADLVTDRKIDSAKGETQ
jgi:hypothetical protein